LEGKDGCGPVATVSGSKSLLISCGQQSGGGSGLNVGCGSGSSDLRCGLCLFCRFRLGTSLGNGLVGSAGAGCGSSSLGSDGAIFALAIKEQPSTSNKDKGGYD